jgi:hypothetical protein
MRPREHLTASLFAFSRQRSNETVELARRACPVDQANSSPAGSSSASSALFRGAK